MIQSQSVPPAVGPYSQGVKAGGFIFTSGQIPADSSGRLVGGDIGIATRQCLQNIREILRAAGATMENIVKVTIFLTDMADFPVVNGAYEAFFSSPPPARSCVQVASLPKGVPIEIEAIAWLG